MLGRGLTGGTDGLALMLDDMKMLWRLLRRQCSKLGDSTAAAISEPSRQAYQLLWSTRYAFLQHKHVIVCLHYAQRSCDVLHWAATAHCITTSG